MRRQLALVRDDTNRRIAELEARIAELAQENDDRSAAEARPALTAPASSAARPIEDRLRIFGDARLRYEHTSIPGAQPSRDRGVLRARLGANYKASDALSFGARLVTGDPDDPNSADVSMGNFLDDLDVSLDQAYAKFRADGFLIAAGKLPNPFNHTDLVWDGDVNPFGVAATYQLHEGKRYATHATAVYMPIDEQSAGRDSSMTGGQLSFRLEPNEDWSLGLDAGWYDYAIRSLANADAGDVRGNQLTPDGSAYASDFNLLDLIVGLTYRRISRWPITLVGDYVKNFGARVAGDSGYQLDVLVGQASNPGDWRIRYGFSLAEQDAVFTAFSHDNITYASNYRLHTVAVDYVLQEHTHLNLAGYLYRLDQFDPLSDPLGGDYVGRLRLNLSFFF